MYLHQIRTTPVSDTKTKDDFTKNNVSWSIIFIRICGFQWLKMILVIWFIINWGERRRSGIRGRFWIKNHFEKKNSRVGGFT